MPIDLVRAGRHVRMSDWWNWPNTCILWSLSLTKSFAISIKDMVSRCSLWMCRTIELLRRFLDIEDLKYVSSRRIALNDLSLMAFVAGITIINFTTLMNWLIKNLIVAWLDWAVLTAVARYGRNIDYSKGSIIPPPPRPHGYLNPYSICQFFHLAIEIASPTLYHIKTTTKTTLVPDSAGQKTVCIKHLSYICINHIIT